MTKIDSVENCLAEMARTSSFPLHANDHVLIHSLASQVDRRIGLTDRQLALARKKIDEYAEALTELGTNIEDAKSRTDLEVRTLDRRRWIKFNELMDEPVISVRFRFSKKLVKATKRVIDNTTSDYVYDSRNKTYHFFYNEAVLWRIVKELGVYNFEIDPKVLEIYNRLCELHKKDYVPGIYNGELLNLPQEAVKAIESEVGLLDNTNQIRYYDRRFKYGLGNFDTNTVERNFKDASYLANCIAQRKNSALALNRDVHPFSETLDSLLELERLPLLVSIPAIDPETVYHLSAVMQEKIAPENISVMFRLDNDSETSREFNTWAGLQNFSTQIHENTQVVFVQEKKVCKPLLRSSWHPNTVLSYAGGTHFLPIRTILRNYAQHDLVIYYYDNSVETFINKLDELETIK